jgi:pilus assembly protein CpaB
MDKKGVLIPLIMAAIAAFAYLIVFSRQESRLVSDYAQTNVIVARTDIPERTILNESLVEQLTIPKKFMSQDAFEVKSPSDIKLISNLVTRIRFPKGNQITNSGLSPLSPLAGLSTKIPPGYRGAVVPISADLLHLIKPGDRVDILVTFEALMNNNQREKVTATILQNVLVLGVGQDLGQGLSAQQVKERTSAEQQVAAFQETGILSVALNPNEVQYLALAQKQGESITVVLRGLGDVEMHPMQMASFRNLFR